MSEDNLWSYLRRGAGPLWEAQRHEDQYSTGIPDVSYSTTHHGWIELKYLPKVPVRPSTPLSIKHFTTDQRNWLKRHGQRGGKCFLFLQVVNEFMLFGWWQVDEIGRVPLSAHRDMAIGHWVGSMDFAEFIHILNTSHGR